MAPPILQGCSACALKNELFLKSCPPFFWRRGTTERDRSLEKKAACARQKYNTRARAIAAHFLAAHSTLPLRFTSHKPHENAVRTRRSITRRHNSSLEATMAIDEQPIAAPVDFGGAWLCGCDLTMTRLLPVRARDRCVREEKKLAD
jgi:hypothetical protein